MQVKNIYKKILIITGKIIFLAFAIISTAFVNNEFKEKKTETINIKIISDNVPMMCTVEDIEKYIKKNNQKLDNKAYYEINFYHLEKILNEKNEIKKSAVYFTPDKQLYIQVTERKPIARIITHQINHYIDDEWKTMKIVNKPYKVPVLLGEIHENPDIFKHYPIYKILNSENLSAVSVFDDIYTVMKTIISDTLLVNYIDYVYIDKNKEIILYPVVGKFQIKAGTAEHFQGKMNKLKLFLTNGINKNDKWNNYSEINLKYKNLIYCTKK